MGSFALNFGDPGAAFALNFGIADQTIGAPVISTGEVVFDPQVDMGLTLALLEAGVLFAPALDVEVVVPTVASEEVFFAPRVDMGLATDEAIATGEVAHEPDVRFSIDPGVITSSEELFAPDNFHMQVLPGHVDDGALYEPFFGTALYLDPIASGEVLYVPRADMAVQAGLLEAGELFAPRADMALAPALFLDEVVHTPALVLDADTQVIVVPHLDAGVALSPIFTTGVAPTGAMFGVRVLSARARGVRVLTPRTRGVRVLE